MSIIRTDNEADSLEILKLVRETADYYRQMAELLDEDKLDERLTKLARARESFIAPFEKVVKQLDELPVRPDPDKELMQQLGGKLTQLFSPDARNAILDKCLEEDHKLADLVRHTKLGELSADIQALLDKLADNLNDSKKIIQALKD
jgi:formyltetrahydrofolate hydrolase